MVYVLCFVCVRVCLVHEFYVAVVCLFVFVCVVFLYVLIECVVCFCFVWYFVWLRFDCVSRVFVCCCWLACSWVFFFLFFLVCCCVSIAVALWSLWLFVRDALLLFLLFVRVSLCVFVF